MSPSSERLPRIEWVDCTIYIAQIKRYDKNRVFEVVSRFLDKIVPASSRQEFDVRFEEWDNHKLPVYSATGKIAGEHYLKLVIRNI
jgi:hypothetical protein